MFAKKVRFLFSNNLKGLVKEFLVALGTMWLVIEVVSFFLQNLISRDVSTLLLSLFLSFAWAFYQSFPTTYLHKKSKISNVEIEIQIGHLLGLENTNISIPSSDCFDVEYPNVISEKTLKAKLIKKEFGNDSKNLEKAIDEYLEENRIYGTIDYAKPCGKTKRFAFGTTVILESFNRFVYITSMAKINNDRFVEGSKESIWLGLCGLWNKVRQNGHLEPIAIPIWGSGNSRARSTNLGLIQLIILSFIIATNESKVCNKLIVAVLKEDYNPELFDQLDGFLNSIEF